MEDLPNNKYYGCDISRFVMKNISNPVETRIGSLTSIPYEDSLFDVTYACEALEHAVQVKNAVQELVRVTKSGGVVVIIDKPVEKLGRLKLSDCEQWICDGDMKKYAKLFSCDLEIIKSVAYENKNDGLFRAWLLKKRLR